MKFWCFGFLAVAFLFVACQSAEAQSDVPKFEVGGHYTFINFNNGRSCCPEMRNGFGGRLTFNINRNVAVEGILNFFPGDVFEVIVPPSTFPKPRLQGLFGLKVGIRRNKFGVFAVAHPGFMHFTPVRDCTGTDFSSCRDLLKTEFAVDFGGAAEAYLSRRVMLRFDIGDTYVRFGDTKFLVADIGPVVAVVPVRGFQSHNLQMSIGAGFRF